MYTLWSYCHFHGPYLPMYHASINGGQLEPRIRCTCNRVCEHQVMMTLFSLGTPFSKVCVNRRNNGYLLPCPSPSEPRLNIFCLFGQHSTYESIGAS